MKLKELIGELQKYDSETEISIVNICHQTFFEFNPKIEVYNEKIYFSPQSLFFWEANPEIVKINNSYCFSCGWSDYDCTCYDRQEDYG